MAWKDINNRVCYMPSDGGNAGDGNDGGGGDSGGDNNGTDALGNSTGTSQDTANTQGYGNNASDANNTGEGSSEGQTDYSSTLGGLRAAERDMNAVAGLNEIGQAYGISVGLDSTYSIFGVTIDYNTHFNQKTGKALGFADEMTADALDVLGIDVTELNIDIAQDVIGITVGVLMGAPAFGLAARGLGLAANVAQSTGQISAKQNAQIQFGIQVASFMYGTMTTMQSLATMAEYSSYMTSTGKLAAIAVSAIAVSQTVTQFNELQAMANALGLDTSDISASDLAGFDASMHNEGDGEWSGALTVQQAYEKLLKWKVLNNITTGKTAAINAEDVFDKMAGGLLYNQFFAGGMYFHPLQQQEQNMAAVGHETKYNQYAMKSLLGSGYVYTHNSKTTKDNNTSEDIDAISISKRSIYRQVQGLQEEANTMIEAFNSKVTEYNSHPSGYDYASAKTALDNMVVQIENKQDSINELVSRL